MIYLFLFFFLFVFTSTATTEIYTYCHTLSLHDALPICYMFFAAGVSAYNVAIFHLFTHAFFKALLFLGAGSVIHAMSDEQDMRKMGDRKSTRLNSSH